MMYHDYDGKQYIPYIPRVSYIARPFYIKILYTQMEN